MRIETLDNFPAELDNLALESPEATFYHTGSWLLSLADAFPAMVFRTLVSPT